HTISASLLFNAAATTEIYTLSLHDALPISGLASRVRSFAASRFVMYASRNASSPHPSAGAAAVVHMAKSAMRGRRGRRTPGSWRSEEHTSELQSRGHLVCRLLLEKKKKQLK